MRMIDEQDKKHLMEGDMDVAIAAIDKLIDEATRLLALYKLDITGASAALDAQVCPWDGIEMVKNKWCQEVNQTLLQINGDNRSLIQMKFADAKGNGSISKYVDIWSEIENKQKVLETFKLELQGIKK